MYFSWDGIIWIGLGLSDMMAGSAAQTLARPGPEARSTLILLAPCRLRTGTSQSVPFVAGVMALILQNDTSASPADVQRLLVASAAAGKLGEVPGSGFSSLEAVRQQGG